MAPNVVSRVLSEVGLLSARFASPTIQDCFISL
jgi:hypothetical protein